MLLNRIWTNKRIKETNNISNTRNTSNDCRTFINVVFIKFEFLKILNKPENK